MYSICVQEGSRVPNLQTEFNYLDSFKSYCIFCDFVVPMWSPCHPHHPHIIPISSPSSPEDPHVIPTPPKAVVSIVSIPCGPHVVPTLSLSSLWSLCHPCCPHVIPRSSRRSPHHLQSPRYPPPWGRGPESVKIQ